MEKSIVYKDIVCPYCQKLIQAYGLTPTLALERAGALLEDHVEICHSDMTEE